MIARNYNDLLQDPYFFIKVAEMAFHNFPGNYPILFLPATQEMSVEVCKVRAWTCALRRYLS